ncbi:hypothetical protein [Maridesulfovibrio sp.]|uniref:hypothetical protein n=1 Tax=Maridesulfovibrio sp. TaxID=2795000 RepID=UPI003AFFB0F4
MSWLTEAEAREKWCPQARVAMAVKSLNGSVNIPAGTPVANRVADNTGDQLRKAVCLGSECMFWRWGKRASFVEVRDEPVGYCGLAESPKVLSVGRHCISSRRPPFPRLCIKCGQPIGETEEFYADGKGGEWHIGCDEGVEK